MRWRLQDIGQALSWLAGHTQPGIYRVLKRLGFSRKRALGFIRSPDREYQAKWRRILQAFEEAAYHPERTVLLFMDEVTYYRRPEGAPAYHRRGKSQPRALDAPQYNAQTRIVAVLNALTGQVTYLQRSQIGKAELRRFYAQLRAVYPWAERIYVAQDNWPVHKLPEVLQALCAQRLVPLFFPTYASWLNPIEKLWKWLKQEVLRMHRWAAQLDQLRLAVTEFLDRFSQPSASLLRYTGLMSE
jgi:transposase